MTHPINLHLDRVIIDGIITDLGLNYRWWARLDVDWAARPMVKG